MALETLAGIEEIGGFKITTEEERNEIVAKHGWDYFDEYRKTHPIHITHEQNMISFRIQNGPIKENGINGCQVDTMIKTALIIIEALNEKFHCKENDYAIANLTSALMWLESRKKNREARGVEGFNKQ